MTCRALSLGAIVLALRASAALAQTSPAGDAAEAKPADPWKEDVQVVVEKVEGIRGGKLPVPLQPARASSEAREATVESIVAKMLARDQLEARGRSWSDLGLGDKEAPRRLLHRISADLEVAILDADGVRMLLAEDLLSDEDYVSSHPDDPTSALLLATGMRPDEPLVAHLATHALQRARDRSGAKPTTTDGLLARAAWSEGEANLIAIGMLFQGLRLADAVLQPGIDPTEVLGGRLVPAGIDAAPMPDRAFLEFVYEDGYDQAIRAFRGGGFRSLEQSARGRATTRDLLHPDRSPLAPAEVAAPAAPGREGEFRVADQDSLGEEGVFAFVSYRTGKDDLALAAADGWRHDRLMRWEPAASSPALAGVTVWETIWGSDDDAGEFAYAVGRAIEDGLGGTAGSSEAAERRSWRTPERTFRLTRSGRSVVVRIASIAEDTRLEAPPPKAQPAAPIKKNNK